MYRCEECGKTFEEPYMVKDDPSPYGVALIPGYYFYPVCPHCGSDVLTLMQECPSCGDYFIGSDVLCNDCMATLADGLDRIRKGMELKQGTFEDAIANHFGW